MSLKYWQQVARHLAAGQKVFVVWVADHTRHSPGTRGAKMGLTRDAEAFGTIGGGVMEANIQQEGQQALVAAKGYPKWNDRIHRRNAGADASGLICAGRQTMAYAILTPKDHLSVVATVVDCLKHDDASVLVLKSDGTLLIESQTWDRDQAWICLKSDSKSWSYREQLLQARRIAIFGGGHCGLALSKLMRDLDYYVTLIEERQDLALLKQNTYTNTIVLVDHYQEGSSRVKHPHLTHALIMTAAMHSDIRALEGALNQPFIDIGLMGAPAKIQSIKQALTEKGVSSQEFTRVRSPIGLNIGSSTPAEIAVSVAAQLIHERHTHWPKEAPTPWDQNES
jgi:xanthine dehydrogenase accessory factor